MAETKKYLDLVGLGHYDEKIKAYIQNYVQVNGSDVTDDLIDLIGASELGSGEKTLIARIAALEAGLGDVNSLESDVKSAVSAILGEATRAKAAEKDLSDKLKAVTDDYLKAADKTELSGLISAEKTRAEGAESGLSTRIAAFEANGSLDVAAEIARAKKAEGDNAAAISAEETRAKGEEAKIAGLVTAEAERADAAEKANKALIEAEEAARKAQIGTLGKVSAEEGAADHTVKSYVDAKVAEVNGDANALKDRVKANEDALALLNNNDQVEGSVAHAVKAEKDRAEGAESELSNRLDAVEAFFETAEGEQLNEALNTLVEIQEYLGTHGEAADKMLTDIAANNKAIEDEAKRADEAEKANKGLIEAEKTRAEGAEGDLSDRLDVIEGEGAGSIKAAVAAEATRINAIVGTPDTGKTIQSEIDSVEGRLDVIEGSGAGSIAKALQDAKDYADGLDSVMDGRVDAIESTLANADVYSAITNDEIDKLFEVKA